MRARNIKPAFFKNEQLAELPPEARLLFIGLWCMADREGLLEDRPKRIKMEIFPADSFDCEPLLAGLADEGLILRHEIDGASLIEIPRFKGHQRPHHTEKESVWRDRLNAKKASSSWDINAKNTPSSGGVNVKTPSSSDTFNVKSASSSGGDSGESTLHSGESTSRSALNPESRILNPEKKDIGLTASLEPDEPASSKKSKRERAKSADIETIFDHWQATHDHPQAKLTDKRRQVIAKALKNYSAAFLCQSISGYLNSPHHMGENPQNTKYDSIELFLRDAEKIDRGLKLYSEPPSAKSQVGMHNQRASDEAKRRLFGDEP